MDNRVLCNFFLFDGSDVNLCKDTVVSSLSIGCENGLDSIVQLMLYNGADMQLVENNFIYQENNGAIVVKQ